MITRVVEVGARGASGSCGIRRQFGPLHGRGAGTRLDAVPESLVPLMSFCSTVDDSPVSSVPSLTVSWPASQSPQLPAAVCAVTPCQNNANVASRAIRSRAAGEIERKFIRQSDEIQTRALGRTGDTIAAFLRLSTGKSTQRVFRCVRTSQRSRRDAAYPFTRYPICPSVSRSRSR